MLWVPGRLLLEASRSAELAHWLTDSVLRGGLLPGRLPPAAAARQWGAIYMAAEPPARSCCRVYRLKFRRHLRAWGLHAMYCTGQTVATL